MSLTSRECSSQGFLLGPPSPGTPVSSIASSSSRNCHTKTFPSLPFLQGLAAMRFRLAIRQEFIAFPFANGQDACIVCFPHCCWTSCDHVPYYDPPLGVTDVVSPSGRVRLKVVPADEPRVVSDESEGGYCGDVSAENVDRLWRKVFWVDEPTMVLLHAHDDTI